MTGAVLDRPANMAERGALGDGLTLEERLDSVLRAVRAGGSTECPVCHERMTATRDDGAECAGCGSRLS